MGITIVINEGEVRFENGDEMSLNLTPSELEISSGEVGLFVGKNGSGKSTLLKTLAGVYPQFDESLTPFLDVQAIKNGAEVQIVPHIHCNNDPAGVVMSGYLDQAPQSNVFFLSAREEVSFGLENTLSSSSRINDTVSQSLNYLAKKGISFNDRPHELSKGQKQLLAFESVVATRPDIVCLDEPSSTLDSDALQILTDRIFEVLYREQVEIIFVTTHDARLESQFEKYNSVNRVKIDSEVNQSNPISIEWPVENSSIRCADLNIEGVEIERGDVSWHDVSLSAQSGEILVLSGKNGSGKSTLLEVIAGHTKPNHGYVTIGDRKKKAGKLRQPPELGIAFQNAEDQICFFDISNELKYPAKLSGWKNVAQGAISHLLKNHTLNPWNMSYGQRKLLVYSTLCMTSSTLLLDEPFSSLDPDFSDSLSDMLDSYISRGGLLLITTSRDADLVPISREYTSYKVSHNGIHITTAE